LRVRIPVSDAARELEARGALKRRRQDHSERVIAHVGALLGRELPPDLIDFYRENVDRLGDFTAQAPVWNDHVGWRTEERWTTLLLPALAVPLFDDGCGNYYGLDLTPGVETPGVYFFDKGDGYERPAYAAGSSLGAFMLLLADHDRSFDEKWPDRWELRIDPDIDKCPRAPAIWAAG
jgi:hypothetical protein